jgi:hypothetical protein
VDWPAGAGRDCSGQLGADGKERGWMMMRGSKSRIMIKSKIIPRTKTRNRSEIKIKSKIMSKSIRWDSERAPGVPELRSRQRGQIVGSLALPESRQAI